MNATPGLLNLYKIIRSTKLCVRKGALAHLVPQKPERSLQALEESHGLGRAMFGVSSERQTGCGFLNLINALASQIRELNDAE